MKFEAVRFYAASRTHARARTRLTHRTRVCVCVPFKRLIGLRGWSAQSYHFLCIRIGADRPVDVLGITNCGQAALSASADLIGARVIVESGNGVVAHAANAATEKTLFSIEFHKRPCSNADAKMRYGTISTGPGM